MPNTVREEARAWREFDRSLTDEIDAAHARNRALEGELRKLMEVRHVATERLRENRNANGHTLSERGRAALISRLTGAVMRATIILGEQRVLFYGVSIAKDERRYHANQKPEAA